MDKNHYFTIMLSIEKGCHINLSFIYVLGTAKVREKFWYVFRIPSMDLDVPCKVHVPSVLLV